MTACAAQVPLGQVVGSLVSDAIGTTLGPAGMGWWVLAAAIAYVGVGLWAVLPLHERAATAIWLSSGLLAWAVAAGCTWMGGGRVLPLVVGNACWMAGAASAAIAMLAAARSVIREVRGIPARQATRKQPLAMSDAASAKKPTAVLADESDSSSPHGQDADDDDPRGATAYVDGSEADDDGEASGRHLSKAERKRLRKLARMNRAA